MAQQALAVHSRASCSAQQSQLLLTDPTSNRAAHAALSVTLFAAIGAGRCCPLQIALLPVCWSPVVVKP